MAAAFAGNASLALRNTSFGDLMVAPSYTFSARWVPGAVSSNSIDHLPFAGAELHLKMINGAELQEDTTYQLQVFRENNIGSQCGFPSSATSKLYGNTIYPFNPFEILTARINAYDEITAYNNDSYSIDTYSGVGDGCLAFSHCNYQGQCDYCYERCHCYRGFGSRSDLLTVGRDVQPDCSSRVCPAGKAIADIPTRANQSHAMAECSNRGICDRKTGSCKCFDPFTGSACERMRCPNDCSGHGRCMSMAEITRQRAYANPKLVTFEYGSANGLSTIAWDHDVVHGCVCDSSWATGFGAGERQLSEFFGPDCSQRRCPSGDDPWTGIDETNCHKKNQLSQYIEDVEYGQFGNKCHVDCSNRGLCDHNTGVCKCFPDSWGLACEFMANTGGSINMHDLTLPWYESQNSSTFIVMQN